VIHEAVEATHLHGAVLAYAPEYADVTSYEMRSTGWCLAFVGVPILASCGFAELWSDVDFRRRGARVSLLAS
jgi:hypothetical protein